ncbi:MAG: phosphate signaling complex protein PhoU [Thermoleophilia bacterium]
MTYVFQRELDKLNQKLLALSALVEESLRQAFAAVDARDAARARAVILGDRTIDEGEVEVEEECLKVLALYQPVAGDLRYLIAVIKITNELERIGDLATNIAERALQIAVAPPLTIPADLLVMAERVESMLQRALDALVNRDVTVAREVLASDDEVDDLYAQLIEQLKEMIRVDLEAIDAIVEIFSVTRYLERLADHATNICEDVLYMVEGEIRRHQGLDDTRPAAATTLRAIDGGEA